MIEEITASYSATLELIGRSVSDLTPVQWVAQPQGIPNHPAWTVGHLVHSAQAIGGEMGLQPWLPDAWGETFGTGSTPVPQLQAYPRGAELLSALELARGLIQERLGHIGTKALAGPLPDVRYREVLPSLGHAVLHILCGHTSFHAGQVMLWRRAMGLRTEGAL